MFQGHYTPFVRIMIPKQLYINFIKCLKELLMFLNAIQVEFRRLARFTLGIDISRDAAAFLNNTEDIRIRIRNYINRVFELQTYLGEYLEQLENISTELIQALSSRLILSRAHDIVIAIFIHNLIRISSNRIMWFNLDDDLRIDIQDNMGSVFTIAESNYNPGYDPHFYLLDPTNLLYLHIDFFEIFIDIWRILGSMICFS